MTFGLHVTTCSFFFKVLFQLTYEMRRRPKLEAGFHVAVHYALFFKNSCLISESEEQNTHPQSMDYPHRLPTWTTLSLVIRVMILSESSLRSVFPV